MAYAGLRRIPASDRRRDAGPMGPSDMKSLPAPIRGWVSNANLASPPKQSCKLLENFFPTQTGVRPRGGSNKIATLGGVPVTRLFSYIGAANKQFAADAGNIYDLSSIPDPAVALVAAVTGRTSGYYSTSLFTTSGGTYLTCVNGADLLLIFDGTNWIPVSGLATVALAFKTQTANFTVGQTLTGATSGATGMITKNIDAGATGTLWLQSVTGTFQDSETITDGAGGSAKADIPSGIVTLAGAITGLATSLLSAVWVYKNRQYFIQGGTQNAYYLGVDSITGALSTLTLHGIFKRGGSLLMGATWSLDAGDGIDDKCVFVTDQGEMAVFEGDYPGATNWSLVGRYDITAPLGKNGTMQAGGDLLILVEDGIVPVSAAVNKDVAALSLSAVSRPIEPEWQTEVQNKTSRQWEIVKWPSHNLALVTLPINNAGDTAYAFVVNIETGAWTKYTGWDARCANVFGDKLYFGSTGGYVYQGETGGSDNGLPYVCQMVLHADHLGSMGGNKTVKAARTTFTGSRPFNPLISVSTDYLISLPSPPNAVADGTLIGWDASLWDVGLWDDPAVVPTLVTTRWVSIGRTGFAVNAQVQITMSNHWSPDCEFVSIDLLFQRGGNMV